MLFLKVKKKNAISSSICIIYNWNFFSLTYLIIYDNKQARKFIIEPNLTCSILSPPRNQLNMA
nr:MAG TPA: hypothetical protein [Caudoviricetes sp.]